MGAVQRCAREAVQRLPARLVPGLSGPRELRPVLLPEGQLHLERLRHAEDDGAAEGRAGREDGSSSHCDHPPDPAGRRARRADHPRLAGQHDRGGAEERARDPEHARRGVHHALLEAVQVLGRARRKGCPRGVPSSVGRDGWSRVGGRRRLDGADEARMGVHGW